MTDYFNDILDTDGNGYLNVDEISEWVEPNGFVAAKSEVVYLMDNLDTNRNKMLNYTEILSDDNQVFLKSQVTFYGGIFRNENIRSQIFYYL